MRKPLKGWALVDGDGDIADLNHPDVGDFYHINTSRKDAISFLKGMKKDFSLCDWRVIRCTITYD